MPFAPPTTLRAVGNGEPGARATMPQESPMPVLRLGTPTDEGVARGAKPRESLRWRVGLHFRSSGRSRQRPPSGRMVIDVFQPPRFKPAPLDIARLDSLTGRRHQYASSGKAALFHLLRSLRIRGKALVPAYLCRGVLAPFHRLGLELVYYDVDVEDLNASLGSIEALSDVPGVEAVLVASLYGNPANLAEIERFCGERSLHLIDDAAQSFGARLDDRYVGSFGSGGFFSFSPGKATAGHMGVLFWSEQQFEVQRRSHWTVHRLKWLDFYYNRLHVYDHPEWGAVKRALGRLCRLAERRCDLYFDEVCEFEKPILGGILAGALDGAFGFRRTVFDAFVSEFESSGAFRVVKALRGEAVPHKLVVVFDRPHKARRMIADLREGGVYASNGYQLLTQDLGLLPNARKIAGCVVEMSLEDDCRKMDYLFDRVKRFAG